MKLTGITTDVPVSSLESAERFYSAALGRSADLAPSSGVLEWILHNPPQIALRLVHGPERAGSARIGIGVDDLEAERDRLCQRSVATPEIGVIPDVIALLELQDDDGNQLVFWENLLPS
jgi:hypothetical protein